jgi:hypothetical protein
MASAGLSRRVEKVVGYSPLCGTGEQQRRELHEALLNADTFEDLPGWVAGGDPQDGAQRQRAVVAPEGRLRAGSRSMRNAPGMRL